MKKLLSVVTASLVAASLFVACSDGESGKPSSKPTPPGPSGVPENAVRNWTFAKQAETEWVICGLEDLQKLIELVNLGDTDFAGCTISLTDDITINKKVLTDDLLEPEEAGPGVPTEGLVNLDSIGRKNSSKDFDAAAMTEAGVEGDMPFKGTIDGKGHVISGYYSYQGHQGLGFIGYSDGAVIKNVILRDACVINMNVWEGLDSNGKPSHDGSDDDRFGGLVGFTNNDGVDIVNCVFVGVVGSDLALKRGEPYEYIGGLVGRCDAAATATNCFVLAKVYGDADVVCKKGAENLTKTDVDGYALDASSDFAALEEAINYIKSIQ